MYIRHRAITGWEPGSPLGTMQAQLSTAATIDKELEEYLEGVRKMVGGAPQDRT